MPHPVTRIGRTPGYPSTTATARVMEDLALYGHTPHADDPEYRPMPEPDRLIAVVKSAFLAFTGPLADTALEPDLADMLWSLANLFHAKVDRVQRQLDDNEVRQRVSQEEQDGSEVRSVELERLIDRGRLLLDKRNACEQMRDEAVDQYETSTGSAWRPRSGSVVNHQKMTAALIDSRDHCNAKRYAETTLLLPAGPKVAFTGGEAYNDQAKIWDVLDKVRVKYPAMVLCSTGNARGADAIAAAWCKARHVHHIAFKPVWVPGRTDGPFKRNDKLLKEAMPIGLVAFPGSGINDNLVDKAAARGVEILDCRK